MSTQNTKYGFEALASNTTPASQSSAFGYRALKMDNSKWNSAFGANASANNVTGISNTSAGINSLNKNITGSYNTAIGTSSARLTTGNSNTVLGSNAFENNTIGNFNTAIGVQTLYNNIDNNNNTAIGYYAGFTDVNGSSNTYLGAHSDIDNNSNTYTNSTAIGAGSLITASDQIKMGLEDGTTNVVIPGSAYLTNLTPTYIDTSIVPKSYVDLIGSGIKLTQACVCATTSDIPLLMGSAVIDNYTVVTGDRVLVKNQDSISGENTNNIENGIYIVNTSGPWTRATDCDTGDDVTGQFCFVYDGSLNKATGFAQISNPGIVGTDPLQYTIFYQPSFTLGNGLELSGNILEVKSQLTGFLTAVDISGTLTTSRIQYNNIGQNIVMGNTSTMSENIGGRNTVIGFNAFPNNILNNDSTIIGYDAAKNISGSNIDGSTAIGYQALMGAVSSTPGGTNTAIGSQSLSSITTGQLNTCVGKSSGDSITSGQYNTSLGHNSGRWNTTSNYNISIGSNSGGNISRTGGFNTIIGSNTDICGNYTNSTCLGYGSKITSSNGIFIGTSGETINAMGNIVLPTTGKSITFSDASGSSINFNLLPSGSTAARGSSSINFTGGTDTAFIKFDASANNGSLEIGVTDDGGEKILFTHTTNTNFKTNILTCAGTAGDGKVGINNVNPTYNLDVNGNFNVKNGTMRYDISGVTFALDDWTQIGYSKKLANASSPGMTTYVLFPTPSTLVKGIYSISALIVIEPTNNNAFTVKTLQYGLSNSGNTMTYQAGEEQVAATQTQLADNNSGGGVMSMTGNETNTIAVCYTLRLNNTFQLYLTAIGTASTNNFQITIKNMYMTRIA